MNIVVCIKQVPDSEATINVKDGTHLDLAQAKKIINPYDEIAVEEALQVKQKYCSDAKITAVSVGPPGVEDALRVALAMGCDDAVTISHDPTDAWLSPLSIGKALGTVIKKYEPQLVFCGKQGIDHDELVVPYVVAETLGISCINVIRAINYCPNEKTLEAVRESDSGRRETFRCPFPAVLGLSTGINKPRYPSLPGIMKAKKKTIETLKLADVLSQDDIRWITPVSYDRPAERGACKMIEGDVDAQVSELAKALRQDLKVI